MKNILRYIMSRVDQFFDWSMEGPEIFRIPVRKMLFALSLTAVFFLVSLLASVVIFFLIFFIPKITIATVVIIVMAYIYKLSYK